MMGIDKILSLNECNNLLTSMACTNYMCVCCIIYGCHIHVNNRMEVIQLNRFMFRICRNSRSYLKILLCSTKTFDWMKSLQVIVYATAKPLFFTTTYPHKCGKQLKVKTGLWVLPLSFISVNIGDEDFAVAFTNLRIWNRNIEPFLRWYYDKGII